MLPTKKQINPFPGDLDGDYAVKNWLGKSIEEGIKMLASNSLHYGEDFSYMGKVAYNYYFDSIIGYAKSKDSSEDSDFVNSVLASTIEFRWEHDKEIILHSKNKVILLLEYIIENYDKYDIDIEIYGDLKQSAISLKNKIKA